MIYIGTDIIEIERIEKSILKKSFLKKVYSEKELEWHEKNCFKAESLAGAFAAKESFSKALGTGFRGFSLNEVEILHDNNGAPYISLTGRAKEILNENQKISVSISHCKKYAAATVLLFEND